VEEFAIEGGSRFLPGRFEVLPGPGQVAGAAVEVAERRVEQEIVPQRRILGGRLQHSNARVWTFDLRDDDRTVEQVRRRAAALPVRAAEASRSLWRGNVRPVHTVP